MLPYSNWFSNLHDIMQEKMNWKKRKGFTGNALLSEKGITTRPHRGPVVILRSREFDTWIRSI